MPGPPRRGLKPPRPPCPGAQREASEPAAAAQQLRHVLAGSGRGGWLPKGARYHDLRHFCASTLIAAGLHPKAIQARLGHATIVETMDICGHLFLDTDDLGRGAVDAVFASAGVQPMCARCVPASDREARAAGQRLGGGRADL